MLKIVRKIALYTGISLAVLILVLSLFIWYLYATADMLEPVYREQEKYSLIKHDFMRTYGPNRLYKNKEGLWELYVEGDAFERGVAIGKLSEDLLFYQETVFINQIREIIPSDNYLNFLRYFIILFNRNLGKNVPEEFREEIYGISLSCSHRYNFIGNPYERQLNYHSAHDLGHAMQDYMLVGCTSFAAWGENTEDAALIIGRNFDFYMGDEFAKNKQVSFYKPETGYKFAAIGWPGMTGILSGMNEHGLTVTINAAKSAMPTSSATPISILTREILQYASTIEEAFHIALQRKTFVSESILIGSAKDGKAVLIEKSPEKTVLFTTGDEKQLICTNHYQSPEFATDKRNIRTIATSDSPYRFRRVAELMETHHPLNPEKAAAILRNHKGMNDANLGFANEMAINQFIAHHSVIFKPEQGLMWVSTSPWQSGKYICYDLDKIFNESDSISSVFYVPQLTIGEDSLIYQREFEQLLTYRNLTPLIRRQTRQNEVIEDSVINKYLLSNPDMYYTYEVVGDYYVSQKNVSPAVENWEKALTLPIPRQEDRVRIQQKINKIK